MRLIEKGEDKDIRLRLLGGVAIRLLCKDVIAEHPRLDRLCGDIDLAGLSENTKTIEEVLQAEGFVPHKEFNFLNVSSRMLFSKDGLKVDVILDDFRMNHRWSIRERLLPDTKTLPIEDLILTKLQVVQLTEKDMIDSLALGLASYRVLPDVSYIMKLCLSSWGFTHTTLSTYRKLVAVSEGIVDVDYGQAIAIYSSLAQQLERTKKPLRWRARAILGERMRWYEVVEDGT